MKNINNFNILFAVAAFLISWTAGAQTSEIKTDKSATYDYTSRTGIITLDSFVTGYVKEVRTAVPADICLLLDFSDSMLESPSGTKKTELLKTAATKFIQDIAASATQNKVNHRISIIRFSSRADVMMDWTEVNNTDKADNVTALINEVEKIDNNNYLSTSTRYDYAFYMAKNVIEGGSNLVKGFTPSSYNSSGYAEYKTDGTSYSGSLPNRSFTISNTTDMVKGNLSGINVQSSPFIIFLTDGGPTGKGKTIQESFPSSSSYTHYIDEPGRDKDNASKSMSTSDPYYDAKRYGNFGSSGAWGTYSTYYTYEQGNITIQFAKELKSKGVKIFSIYLGNVYPKSAGETLQNLATDILEGISSKYPDATRYRMCHHGTATTDTTSFFQWVTDTKSASSLTLAFTKISSAIEKVVAIQYGEETIMNDFINNTYFRLTDAVDPANPWASINVYKVKCTGVASDGTTRTFSLLPADTVQLYQSDGIILKVIKAAEGSTDNDQISVAGFNYSENWCGMYNSEPHGCKLLVKVPFKFTGEDETVPSTVETNDEGSGVYPAERDEDGNIKKDDEGNPIYSDEPEKEYISPTITFCRLKVTRYNLDPGESAIYEVTQDGKFVARLSLNGTDQTSVSKILYGLPGGKYKVTETGWNWAYLKDPTCGWIEQPVDNPDSTEPVNFVFRGVHKTGTGPEDLHNHDEEYKVNIIDVTTFPSPKAAPLRKEEDYLFE